MAIVYYQLHIHRHEPTANSFIYELLFPWIYVANCMEIHYTYT